MQSKGSTVRLTGMVIRSRASTLFLSMLATFASLYVAGRLWQDSQNRVYLAKELDRLIGQARSVMSVDDSWRILECRLFSAIREQQKKLSGLEMELAAARQEGFVSKHLSEINKRLKRRPLVVIGILTGFGRKNNRDAIRKAWLGTGLTLKKMEEEKGIIVQFVIGRSSNRRDSLDRSIDSENKQTNDIFILENHVEAPEELPNKTKLFFAYAAESWDADYYAKVNDDVYVNVDALQNTLIAHLDKPRVYIGCMKSGEVFSEQGHKWYEPDWWKFGDGKSYFRHASGEMFVISQSLAKFISINRSILRAYAHDDVSVGSWFIGVDVKHVDDINFCCSSWSSALCSGV
ncbi:Hydroxyproline O-galactosyltransferase HPGT1 [Orobanche gracilis]